MDLVVRTTHMPAGGQTVLGNSFATSAGGKGANQAVAIARLGNPCRMIGRVGDDRFGETLRSALADEGVDVEHVCATPDVPTGVALIIVDAQGENAIVVSSGANFRVTPDDLFSREQSFADADVVVLQLELPLPTVRAAVDLARRNGCKVILDPAPAPKQFPAELFQVDIISPNASEAELLTGQKAVEERIDKLIASDLIARGAKVAVLKLGSRGALVVCADGHFYRARPYKVDVVDSTAAGDAFTGALAVAVARGDGLHEAAKFANAAGALACTRFGAQSTMPSAAEIKMLMDDQPR